MAHYASGMTTWSEKSFYDWLIRQRDRHDPVGDFAKDAWQDAAFPRRVASEADLVGYMEGRGAHEDAVVAARDAWEEFGEAATEFVNPDEVVDADEADEDRR